jgi:gliding motility-associated-like protein
MEIAALVSRMKDRGMKPKNSRQNATKTLPRWFFLAWIMAGLLGVPAGQPPSAGLRSFSIRQVSPQRIFTPNGDGVNDRFRVSFDNPADSPISSAKVFDLTGAEVGEFRLNAAGDALEWDGRNPRGSEVTGGVYVYRIQVDRDAFTGYVVVAR